MMSLRFLALAAALAVAGCGKKAASPSAGGPGSGEPANPDPVAVARRHAERGENSSAVLALGATRNDAEARETWLQGAATLRQVADERELKQQTGSMQSACAQAGVGRFDAAG